MSLKPQGTSCYLQQAEDVTSAPKILPVTLEEEKILLNPVIPMCVFSGHSMTILCRNKAEAQSPDGNAKLPKILVVQTLGFTLGDSKAH